jgi:hypothetical protein
VLFANDAGSRGSLGVGRGDSAARGRSGARAQASRHGKPSGAGDSSATVTVSRSAAAAYRFVTGDILEDGDVLQGAHRDRVESRLVPRSKDTIAGTDMSVGETVPLT